MHNGTTVIDDYGQNLDKLKVGDRVAVVRKDNGIDDASHSIQRVYYYYSDTFL